MSAVKTAAINTWRGLIQRRLWPVALVLVLALVAVPVLLLAKPEEPAPAPAHAEVAGDAAGIVTQPLVAPASASDRERVRRVLGDRKDPFKPSNQPRREREPKTDSASTGADTAPSGSSGSSGGSGTGSAPADTYRAPSVGVSPVPTATPIEPEATPDKPKRPAGSLTVRWGPAEAEELDEIDVERLDPLPSAEEPVLVYLGVTEDGDSAVFLVDAGVTVEGDARCRPNPGDCQTFELEAGETEFIEIEVEGEGGEKIQYQLDLVKIHGRTAERAKAARRSRADEATATRRALRALGRDEPQYRFDARTGTLELIGAGS